MLLLFFSFWVFFIHYQFYPQELINMYYKFSLPRYIAVYRLVSFLIIIFLLLFTSVANCSRFILSAL